jgi:hypothetical protein
MPTANPACPQRRCPAPPEWRQATRAWAPRTHRWGARLPLCGACRAGSIITATGPLGSTQAAARRAVAGGQIGTRRAQDANPAGVPAVGAPGQHLRRSPARCHRRGGVRALAARRRGRAALPAGRLSSQRDRRRCRRPVYDRHGSPIPVAVGGTGVTGDQGSAAAAAGGIGGGVIGFHHVRALLAGAGDTP